MPTRGVRLCYQAKGYRNRTSDCFTPPEWLSVSSSAAVIWSEFFSDNNQGYDDVVISSTDININSVD